MQAGHYVLSPALLEPAGGAHGPEDALASWTQGSVPSVQIQAG